MKKITNTGKQMAKIWRIRHLTLWRFFPVTEDTRRKDKFLNRGKHLILEIQIWNSIFTFETQFKIGFLDTITASRNTLKTILHILSIWTPTLFSEIRLFVWKQRFFLASWSKTKQKNPKNCRADLFPYPIDFNC